MAKQNSTAKSPRVSPPIENEHKPLGVPGSLNMTLSGARRRQQARRRGRSPARWIRPLLMVMGALTFIGVVGLVILWIAFPPYFRDLPGWRQEQVIEWFPWATYWKATIPFNAYPTPVNSTGEDAAFQLMTQAAQTANAPAPDSTELPGAAELAADTTTPPALTPTPTGGGLPAGMLPTFTPTDLPNLPSPTPNTGPTWTPAYVPTEQPLPSSWRLDGIRYEQQGWNNCGPTTMTMALSFFGWMNKQDIAAKWMKPNSEDKNVSPWQMVRFVNDNTAGTGVKALYRIGGNMQLLKRLLANNFPVIIEESIQPADDGWMGHYVLLMGYNDLNQEFLSYDSFLGYNQGNGRSNPYTQMDESWRHFNRVFIVLYPPSRELDLRGALGSYVDPAYANEIALEVARAEIGQNYEDKWAWFNAGTAYVAMQQYEDAAIAYDQAFRLTLPFRMLWYQFGPFEAYYHVGRYDDVLAYVNSAMGTTKYVEEFFYYQGLVYAARGQMDASLSAFDQAIRFNPNFFPASDAKVQVESGTFQTVAAGQ